jgi:hypothetical protein
MASTLTYGGIALETLMMGEGDYTRAQIHRDGTQAPGPDNPYLHSRFLVRGRFHLDPARQPDRCACRPALPSDPGEIRELLMEPGKPASFEGDRVSDGKRITLFRSPAPGGPGDAGLPPRPLSCVVQRAEGGGFVVDYEVEVFINEDALPARAAA